MKKIFILLMLLCTLFCSCGKEQEVEIAEERQEEIIKKEKENSSFELKAQTFEFEIHDVFPKQASYYVESDNYLNIRVGEIYAEKTLATEVSEVVWHALEDTFRKTGTYYTYIEDTKEDYMEIVELVIRDTEAPEIKSMDFTEYWTGVKDYRGNMYLNSEELPVEKWYDEEEFKKNNFWKRYDISANEVEIGSVILVCDTFNMYVYDYSLENIYFQSNGLPYLYFMDIVPEGGDIEDVIIIEDAYGNLTVCPVTIHVVDNREEATPFVWLLNKEIIKPYLPDAAYARLEEEIEASNSAFYHNMISLQRNVLFIEEETIEENGDIITFSCEMQEQSFGGTVFIKYDKKTDQFDITDNFMSGEK